MSGNVKSHKSRKGILNSLKTHIDRRRLGELLVSRGYASPEQLRMALRKQKETGSALGQVFLEMNFITRRELGLALGHQYVLRTVAAGLFILASFGSKISSAGYIKDVPGQISLVSADDVGGLYTVARAHPSFLGTAEKRSTNLKPFTKWTSMFDKFEKDLQSNSGNKTIDAWQEELVKYKGLPLKSLADKVNAMVNKTPYITDNRNYGQSDYWATPVEFLKNGGDCEDYAIAKYTALRILGVPESRLRISIVHDNLKNIPHAILIVYTDEGAFMLDNQNDSLARAEQGKRYRPIYSINQQAWWLHTNDKSETMVASATN